MGNQETGRVGEQLSMKFHSEEGSVKSALCSGKNSNFEPVLSVSAN